MKFAPYIRVLSIIIVATIAPTLLFSQVLTWQGTTTEWSDVNNWIDQSGQVAEYLPDERTHVIIPSSYSGEILLPDGNLEVASLSVLGNNSVEMTASQSTQISVRGSVNFSDAVVLSQHIEIIPTGTFSESVVLSAATQLQDRLTPIGGSYERLPAIGGTRGACPFFDLVADPTAPTCNGFEDGIAAVLEPTTGVGPYEYQWIGGPDTREWTGLGAGTYTVIVLDLGQGGLPCNIDVFVNEPGPVSVFSLNESPPTCADICNGQAAPIVIGGNGGYTLSWSSGEMGLFASSLCETFTLDIVDSEGCTADTTVTFTNIPDPITIGGVVTGITCFGADDGIIDITSSGGTGTLNFSWSGPSGFTSISEDLMALAPGSYTLTVTDDNNCTESETFEVIENSELLLSTAVVDNQCNGESMGEVDLTIIGGLPTYNISWTGPAGFSSANEDINGLVAGNYEVTVTDAANCVVITQQVVQEPAILSALITPTDLLCFEDNTGQLNAVASGGTPDYTYQWSGPNGFNAVGANQVGLESGTYDLTVSDDNGCVFEASATIDQPTDLAVTFSETPISCNGDADGQIDLTVTGGTPNYNFSWTGPNGFSSINEDISGLSVGVYQVVVTDNNGCSETQSYNLAEPLLIQLSAVTVDPNCVGDNSGEINLTILNGTPPYNVNWSGPNGFTAASEDINDLEPGVYTVVVTDAGGCFESNSFTIEAPVGITADFTQVDVSCFEGNDGSIDVVVSGGLPPYNFDWTGPDGFTSVSQNLTGSAAGVYDLIISDNNGCPFTFQRTILAPSDINVIESITDVTCSGDTDGEITLTVNGATPNYNFSWTGPSGFSSADQDIFGLESGDYELQIVDANNCLFEFSYTVNEPAPIVLVAGITDVLCAGELTGIIDLTVNGGNPPYNFSWSGPNGFTSANEDISGLAAGNYTVNLTDNLGCTTSGSFEIQEQFEIILTTTASQITCFGEDDGLIDLSISGGVPPYLIDWSGPSGFVSSNEDVFNLAPGLYEILVTDANGCGSIDQVIITQPAEILLDLVVTNVNCFNQNDGAIVLNSSGGTPPLSIFWTGPNGFVSGDQNLINLEPGDYNLTVTDMAGCEESRVVTITESTELTLTTQAFNANCSLSDGLAVASATGGSGVLTYTWRDAMGVELAVNDSLIGVPSGTYEVTVTDALGCTTVAQAQISDSDATLTGTVANPSCSGGNNGAILTQITGGTAPFNYEWTDDNGVFSTAENVNNLTSGTYMLSVTDASGCTYLETFELIDPAEIIVNITVSQISCAGSDGSISLAIQNAQSPFDVNWTGPNGFSAVGTSISNLEGGDYDYSFTDVFGCSSNGTVTIDAAGPIVISESVTNVLCSGESNGSIDLDITGGVPPFSFTWTEPNGFTSVSEDLIDLAPGQYSVTVFDQALCTESIMVEITEPTALGLTVVETQSDCNQANGSLEAIITGGTIATSYQISWTDDQGIQLSNTALVENISAGIYTIEVTDDNGCQISSTVSLSDSGSDVSWTATPETCPGQMNGSIDLLVGSIAEPYTVTWSGPDGFTSMDEDISGLASGTYAYVVTAADGCMYTETIELVSPDGLTISFTSTNTCFGVDEGQLSVAITSGDAPFVVTWSGPAGFTSDQLNITDLAAGDYMLNIEDAIGCDFDTTFQITQNSDILTTIVTQPVACFGESNGAIDLEVTGGEAPLTISWSGPNGFTSADEDLINLIAGDYNLLLVDADGCETSDIAVVTENSELSISVETFDSNCLVSDGLAVATGSGGFGILTYTWRDAFGVQLAINDSLIGVPSGTYEVTVTDELGCTAVAQAQISDSDATLSGTVANPSCSGGNNGAILTQITGGTAPFDYEWTDNNGVFSTAENVNNLTSGTYMLSVTDASGCTYLETFELIDPAEIVVNITVSQISCVGSDGSISLAIQNAQSPFDVNWTGPDGFSAVGTSISNLDGGDYDYSFTDALGCSSNGTVTIDAAGPILISETSTNVLCSGESNGSIDLDITGGVPPFSFTWTGPNGFTSISEDLMDLAPGQYSVTVFDQALCTASMMVEITEPTTLALTVVENQSDCNQANGSLEALITGGTTSGAYQISWTDDLGIQLSNSALIENLSAGIYNVEVTDDNGCQISSTVSLSDSGGDVSWTATPETCPGQMNGSIDLLVGSIAEPYTVVWSGPDGFTSIDEDISALASGTYAYIVTAADGCMYTETIELVSPDGLTISFTSTNTCFGVDEGQLSVAITSGDAPFVVTWSGPAGFTSDQLNITDLAAGDYMLNIEDAIGCDFDTTFQITQNSDILTTIVTQPVACFGESNGAIDLEVTGGEAPLTISWSGPNGFTSADEDLINLMGGDYVLTVIDAGGCEYMETIVVDQPAEIVVVENVIASGCANQPNSGSISLNVSGGEPGGYLFEWTGPNGFMVTGVETIENLEAGLYTYVITDMANCTSSNTLEITEVTPIQIALTSSDPLCNGELSGAIDATITGGMAPFGVSWSGPGGYSSMDQNIAALAAGEYVVTILDAAGCDATDQILLSEPDTLQIQVNNSAATCENVADGTIETIIQGGNPEYIISWQGPDGYSSNSSTNLNLFTGEYTLSLVDANGCEARDTVQVDVLFEVDVLAGADTMLCPSSLPVTLIGSVSGGDEFFWTLNSDTLSQTNDVTIDQTFDTDFELILIGSNGTCSEQDTIQVQLLPNPDVDAGEDIQVFSEENFTLGGSPTSIDDVVYNWSPNTETVSNLNTANPFGFITESQTFIVTVTDQNGCSSSDTTFVRILPNVDVTSGFTPNGDGVNDNWVVANTEFFPNIVVRVFSRWGVEVFASSGLSTNISWDGTFGGEILPSGTYYYTIELNDSRFPEPIVRPLTLHR